MRLSRAVHERRLEYQRDPVRYARERFGIDPDEWQKHALMLAAKPKADGRHRLAMKACAGPGKTAVLAWLAWWRLECFVAKGEHPKGAAVSIDEKNLKDNLWAEMAKWQERSPFLKEAFVWQKERIYAKDHPETWFLSARGWPKTADPEIVGRALSGLHSQFPFYLIDESGDIPPNMARSAEQGLTTCVDGLIVTAGNTTSQTGMLYDVCTNGRAETSGATRWEVVSITADPNDPQRTPRVPAEYAQEQIDKYGRDNPWVMAYILGQFPPGSINALLSIEEVDAAMNRRVTPDSYEWAQKRLGIDVARFGDDRTVIFPRQGLVAMKPQIMRHKRDSPATVDIANAVMFKKNEWGSEMEFFDNTFQWGAGAIDTMRAAGHSPIAVSFDRPAGNERYANMRAQCWMLMAEWIKSGGALPPEPGLVQELTAPTYFFTSGKFQLEPKDQIKKRLGKSPDLAEALALTFALPDMPAANNFPYAMLSRQDRAKVTEFNPLSRMR